MTEHDPDFREPITPALSESSTGCTEVINLFNAISVIHEIAFDGRLFGRVKVVWQAYRAHPIVPYEAAVNNHAELEWDEMETAEESVDGLLSEDEVSVLRHYLREKHGFEVTAEKVSLPIDTDWSYPYPTQFCDAPHPTTVWRSSDDPEFPMTITVVGVAFDYKSLGYVYSAREHDRGVRYLRRMAAELPVVYDLSDTDLARISSKLGGEGFVVEDKSEEWG